MGYLMGMIDNPNTSYWEINELARHYFSTTSDSNASYFSKKYSRWEYFWKSRVDATGDRLLANQRVIETVESGGVCDENGAWYQVDNFIRSTQNNGIVTAVYAPPGQGTRPDLIYIGSNTGGMWKTEDGGDTWVCLTDELNMPALGINDIVPDPNNPKVIYVATGNTGAFQPRYGTGLLKYKENAAGVWEWHNTGLSWNLSDPFNNPGRASLKILMHRAHSPTTQYPHTPVYVLAGNSVFRSDDEGVTFQEADLSVLFPGALPYGYHLMDIDMVRNYGPAGEEVLFVTTYPNQEPSLKDSRIYKKVNEGAGHNLSDPSGWSEIPLANLSLSDPSNIGTFFSATCDAEDGVIYVTGALFRPVNQGGMQYFLWRSHDLGASFTRLEITDNIGSDGRCKNVWAQRERPEFLVHPVNSQVMYIADNCLKRISSINWNNPTLKINSITVSDYEGQTHADIRDIQIYQPSPSGLEEVVLIGTDGGVSQGRFNNHTLSVPWQSITDFSVADPLTGATPLVLTQYFDIANTSTLGNYYSGGAQDNGWLRGNGPGGTLLHLNVGDGGQTIVSWDNPSVFFVKGNSDIRRYLLPNGLINGNTGPASGDGDVSPFPFRQDPFNPNIIYSGMNNNLLNNFVQFDFSQNTPLKSNGINFAQAFTTVFGKAIETFEVTSDPNPLFYLTPNKGSGKFLKGEKNMATGLISWVAMDCSPLNYNQCSAIAVDPHNSDRVWFGLAGFSGDRIYYSDDGGSASSWVGFRGNANSVLPSLPVNDIVYVEGSNNVLYAATDVGVYKYVYDPGSDPQNPQPATNGYWECFNNGLPVCIVTDLEIDYCRNMLVVGTYGRGIWETPIDDVGPRKITQNTTWETGTFRNLGQDLIIEPGVTLTIKGQVNIGNGWSIIVKPNARLIVDGGTLTNQCGGTWKGIEVWGDKTKDQLPYAHPLHQGYVEFKNGALVEHAINAVVNGKRFAGGTTPSGGLIVAKNSTFRNNRRSIEFLKYTINNGSRIEDCTFLVENDGVGGNDYRFTDYFTSHISMWGVKGVRIEASTFENQLSGKFWNEGYSCGIFTIDAGFSVAGECSVNPAPGIPCPTNALTMSRFIGFNHGIKATGSSTINNVSVTDASFDDNVTGIMIGAIDNAAITRSDFEVGSSTIPSSTSSNHEGIVMIDSDGFVVENNSFSESTTAAFTTRGIRVTEAGESNNEIYRNSFEQIDNGVLGEGKNRSGDALYGLQFLCNDFLNIDEYDIDITSNSLFAPVIATHGVRGFQGNLTLSFSFSAGNEFWHQSSPAENDIRNYGGNVIDYRHTGGITQPLSISSKVVPALTSASNANPCPAYTPNSSLVALSAGLRGELGHRYESADSSHAEILYNYNQLIDGGSTTQLLAQIQQSWSQGAWELRNDLMAESPYVSEEVLRQVAEDNLLPHAMLLEVCLANPDATRSEGFLDYLEYQVPNPLPGYMIDMIVASWGTVTARTLLEDGLAYFGREKAVASNLLLAHYKADSVNRTDSIRYWLRKRGELSDEYALVESFIEAELFDSAYNRLQALPAKFEMDTQDRLDTHNDYLTYFNLRKSFHQAGKSIMELDSLNQRDLGSFAFGSDTRAANLAGNILCFFYGSCKDASESGSGGGNARLAGPPLDAKKVIQSEYYQLRVFPNPASDFATFEWKLVNLESTASIQVFDAVGRVVATKVVTTAEGQWLLDTRTLPKGMYFFDLHDSEGNLLAQGKLTLE